MTVSTAPVPEDLIAVRVSDTGSGIDPNVMEKLFQPFVTTKKQGMGVGLSICRTIVEAHGGKISVEANPGGGTTFCVTLPGVSLRRDAYMTREKVVCVIDDDEAARDSLAFLLETDGFVVEAYELAVAFIDAGPTTRGSCIVTDVRMPGMDGIAMLRELRVRGDNRPVIVVTGHADIPACNRGDRQRRLRFYREAV